MSEEVDGDGRGTDLALTGDRPVAMSFISTSRDKTGADAVGDKDGRYRLLGSDLHCCSNLFLSANTLRNKACVGVTYFRLFGSGISGSSGSV